MLVRAAATDDPVLVLTQPFDPTADYVVAELNRRGVPVFRCDPGDFPQRLTLTARLSDGLSGRVCLADAAGRQLALDRVRCAYYRRPSAFALPDDLAESAWAAGEARMGFGGVLSALPRWLNHPAEIARAEYKPTQLVAAHAAGLRVPATLITNDPHEARQFAAERDTVYKPLTSRPLSDSRVLYTTAITSADCDQSIRHTASLFQQRLQKQYEIRATYVDGRIYAARIDAHTTAGRADWRADYENLSYSTTSLPADTIAALDRLMNTLRLRFGAIDLVVAPDGEIWFLEVNPNGQWAWIEDATGLPITTAIADALTTSIPETATT